MYQQNKKFDLSYLNNPEKEFKGLKQAFMDSIYIHSFEKNSSEWDLSKVYIPIWTSIWNKQRNLWKPCEIVQKDNEIALVSFQDDNKISMDKIYRLEDLQPLK